MRCLNRLALLGVVFLLGGSLGSVSNPGASVARELNILGLAEQAPNPEPDEALSYRLYLPVLNGLSLPNGGQVLAPGAIFGVETHSFFPLQKVPGFQGNWYRRNGVVWSEVEPEPGARHWEALAGIEAELAYAAEQGIEAILVVRGTPAWAQAVPGSYCGPIQREDFQAFASFMYDLVVRYSQPPYSVDYWEIWNEPEVDSALETPGWVYGCWGDSSDPYFGGGYYADLLKAVYPQIKAANPAAQVLVGGLMLVCDPQRPGACQGPPAPLFFEGILRNGGAPYFDGVSFHAYDYYAGDMGQYSNRGWNTSAGKTGPVVLAKAHYLRELLARYEAGDKFLMNTETAMITDQKICDEACELTKADYMPQLFAVTLAEGLRASIWFSINSSWRNSGLFDSDSAPLPAYDAYLVAWERLSGATFSQMVDLGANLRTYEFYRQGHMLWVLWALDSRTHTISLPGPVVSLVDSIGQAVQWDQDGLSVTRRPVYLEWEQQ